MLFYNSLQAWAGYSELILLYIVWQKWYVNIEIRFQKNPLASVCFLSLPQPFVWYKRAAVLWTFLWRGPYGKELRKRPLANSQGRIEILSPTAQGRLNLGLLALKLHDSVGSRFLSSQALRWDCRPSWHLDYSLWKTLSQGQLVTLHQNSWHTETLR